MSHRIAKKIRKSLFAQGVEMKRGLFGKDASGAVHASNNRKLYQKMKKEV